MPNLLPIKKPTLGIVITGILIASLAIFLLSIAIPRVKSTFLIVTVEKSLSLLHRQQPLDMRQIPTLMEITQKCITAYDAPNYWQDLGELYFFAALQQGGRRSNAGKTGFKVASVFWAQALKRAPANAYLWFKLASINQLLESPSEQVALQLMLSMTTGPHESNLIVPRLVAALPLAAYFKKDSHNLLNAQLHLAWKLSPKHFINLLQTEPAATQALRSVLQEHDPILLNQINAALVK